MNRRDAIRLGVGAGLGAVSLLRSDLGLSPALRAQSGAPPVVTPPSNPRFPQAPSWPTELRRLKPNVFAYVQAGGPGAYPEPSRFAGGRGVSNSGVIVADDHLVVIDTLGQPVHVKNFKTAIHGTIGSKPVGRIINTHHHTDHVSGNQFFTPVEIVGHEFTREAVLEMAEALPPNARFPAIEGGADGSEALTYIAPDTTYEDRLTCRYGETVVELVHLGIGHTWGDTIVYLPREKVMFSGDVFTFYTVPFSQHGQIGTWMKVVDRILAMDVETVVPGHGPLGGRKEMLEMREYFQVLVPEVRRRYDAGMSAGRAAAGITLGKFDNWIGAERIVLNTCRLYEEWNGTIQPTLDIPFMKRAADEFNAIKGAA